MAKKATKKKAAKKKASKKKASKKKAAAKKKTAKKKAVRRRRQPVQNVPKNWASLQEVADLVGVTTRTIQNWRLEPVAKKGRYTYFDIAAVIKEVAARERKKGHIEGLREGRQSVPEDYEELILQKEQAELARTQEQAENLRLRNEQLRRSLAPVDMLAWALGDLAAQMAAVLEPLPGRIKRSLPKLTNAEIQLLQKEIVKAQNLASAARLDWDEYEPE